jgi:hypothetical protein
MEPKLFAKEGQMVLWSGTDWRQEIYEAMEGRTLKMAGIVQKRGSAERAIVLTLEEKMPHILQEDRITTL